MPIARFVRRVLRGALESKGYWIRSRSVLPYGIDWQLDLRRIAEILGMPVRTFFDIGAHTGETSLSVLHNFAEAVVFAFEPHPVTFSALTENVQDLRFEAFNIAISDKAGRAQFFEYVYHSGAGAA